MERGRVKNKKNNTHTTTTDPSKGEIGFNLLIVGQWKWRRKRRLKQKEPFLLLL